jgi:hypothetical protein
MVLLGRRGKGREFPAHFPGCMHIPGGLPHYRREAGRELPTNGPTVKVLYLMIISLYSNKEISMSGINYQALRNYAWAASRVAGGTRSASLTMGRGLGLPEHEQDFWLRKAEDLACSRNRLRQEVRASLAERAAADDRDAPRASLATST